MKSEKIKGAYEEYCYDGTILILNISYHYRIKDIIYIIKCIGLSA